MQKISIMIAGYRLIREAWAFLLQKDSRFEVVATCSTNSSDLGIAWKNSSIVIIDIDTVTTNVPEFLKQQKKNAPASKVIIVSTDSTPFYVRRMIQEGAKGYITKDSFFRELLQSIIEVYNGETYICLQVKEIISKQVLSNETDPERRIELSDRQKEIVHFLKRGLSSKAIAEELKISYRTVQQYRYELLKKVKAKNTLDLINKVNDITISSWEK